MSEEAPRPPALGIVFTHGDMARGMVDAVRRITGVEEGAIVALSNAEGSPEALASAVDGLAGDRPTIVFTDLHSGSCATVARFACRGRGRRAVVTGVNLAMLLDFVFHRETPLPELAERLVEKGREAVVCMPEDHGVGGGGGA